MQIFIDKLISSFQEDIIFLREELEKAVDVYTQKNNDETTSKDKLKALNWEVIEYTNLLQQSLNFEFCDKAVGSNSAQIHIGVKPDLRTYLRKPLQEEEESDCNSCHRDYAVRGAEENKNLMHCLSNTIQEYKRC